MSAGGFNFYRDASMTAPVVKLQSIHDADDAPTVNDFQVWLGSPDPARRLESSAGNLVITVEDSAPSTGYAVTAIKLATTEGGLGAGGQSLDLGASGLDGGVANAFAFWLRINEAIGAPGVSGELSLALSPALAR